MPHLTNVQINHDLDLVRSSTTASTSESYRSTDASRYRSVSMTSSDEEMPLAQRARKKTDQAQESLGDENYSAHVDAVRSISVDKVTQVEIRASRRHSSQETGIPLKDGAHNIGVSGNLGIDDCPKSAISQANNATASVHVRCQKCSARHRKCLHNAFGQLDGAQCDEWLSDRIVRNSDTGNLGNGEMRLTEEAVKVFRQQRSISGKTNDTTRLPEGWWHSFSKQKGATRLKSLVFTESERVRKLYLRTSSDSQVLFKVQQSSSDLLQIEPMWDRLYAQEWTEVSMKYIGDNGNIHPISSHLANIVFTYIILTDHDDSSLSFQKLWRQVEDSERLRIQRGEMVPSKSRIRRLTLEALLQSERDVSGNDNSGALSEDVSDEHAGLDGLALEDATLPHAPETSGPQSNDAQLDAPTETKEKIAMDVSHVDELLRPGCSPLSSIHEFERETPEDEVAGNFHAVIERLTSSAYNATASSKVTTTFVEGREGQTEPQAMELDDSDEEANQKHSGGAGIGELPRVLPQRSPCKRNRLASQESNQRQADTPVRRILKDEKPAMPQSKEFQSFIASLKNSGYDFEPSEDDDDEEEEETVTSTGQKAPSSTYTNIWYDPLQAYKHTKDKHSRYYKPRQEHSSLDASAPQLLGQKITKGQGLKNSKLVRRRAMYRNLQMFGNAHKECDRSIRYPEGYALVERRVPNTNDKWAHDVIDGRMEKVSFAEFCGFSRDDEFEPCLIGDGEKAQLAFRKKEDAIDHGKRRRVKNDEKWPVYPV